MATRFMGRVGVVWLGEYAGGTAYDVLDMVRYGGSSYICTAASTGNLPTDTDYWALAASGADYTGSPAGAYADLAALNLANPDHLRVYVTLGDGKWCYYDSGTSAFVAGGAYQAPTIVDGTVYAEGLAGNILAKQHQLKNWESGGISTIGENFVSNNQVRMIAPIFMPAGTKFDLPDADTVYIYRLIRYDSGGSFVAYTAGGEGTTTISADVDGYYRIDLASTLGADLSGVVSTIGDLLTLTNAVDAEMELLEGRLDLMDNPNPYVWELGVILTDTGENYASTGGVRTTVAYDIANNLAAYILESSPYELRAYSYDPDTGAFISATDRVQSVSLPAGKYRFCILPKEVADLTGMVDEVSAELLILATPVLEKMESLVASVFNEMEIPSDIADKIRGTASTKIVAASDSLQTSQDSADYVCTGTDDQETIRDAIHDAMDIGDGGATFAWTHPVSYTVPTIAGLDFPLVWYDGTTYYAFGSYASFAQIRRATSPDGINWTLDTDHTILNVGTSGAWDDTTVAVFNAWQEGGTWKALYRGTHGTAAATGLATSADGITWTKEATNPVLAKPDPAGIMKVGSTYYLYNNTTGGDRNISVSTSTDLKTWTTSSPDPVFEGGRFCCCPFKYDSNYYLIISKYYEGGIGASLELWKSPSPFFPYGNREFLGLGVYGRDLESTDTPTIVTLTIERDTFPSGEFWCYYAQIYGGGYPGYLVKEDTVAAAIASVVKPRGGKTVLLEGTYVVGDDSMDHPSLELLYGSVLEGPCATIKAADDFGEEKTRGGIILVNDGCTLSGVTLDGNYGVASTDPMFVKVAQGGVAKDVRITRCGNYSIVSGSMYDSTVENNYGGSTTYAIRVDDRGSMRDSRISGNANTYGVSLTSGATLINCDICNNAYYGFYVAADNEHITISGGKVYGNGYHGGLVNGSADLIGVELFGHTSSTNYSAAYTNHAGAVLRVMGCNIHDNQRGLNSGRGAIYVQGGAIHDNAYYGAVFNASAAVNGTHFYENVGGSNYGQVIASKKCRFTNCVFGPSTTQQKNMIYFSHADADGSVVGGCELASGSVGYLGAVLGVTLTEYNNEEVT